MKRHRTKADSAAGQFAHAYAQHEEAYWLREVMGHPVAQTLIGRFNETTEGRRQCRHLTKNWDQAKFWVETVPELLACANCTPVLAMEEQKRRDSRCLMCRQHVALRGISVATGGGLLFRGGVCASCEEEYGALKGAQ